LAVVTILVEWGDLSHAQCIVHCAQVLKQGLLSAGTGVANMMVDLLHSSSLPVACGLLSQHVVLHNYVDGIQGFHAVPGCFSTAVRGMCIVG
jgi:hypothetical protein